MRLENIIDIFSVPGAALLVVYTYPLLGENAIVFCLIPIIFVARRYGVRGGMFTGLGAILFSLGIFLVQGFAPTNHFLIDVVILFTLFLLSGYLTGSLVEINRVVMSNERRFRAMIEQGDDVTAVFSSGLEPLYVSPTVEKTLGYTSKEVYSMSLATLIHPQDAPLLEETIQQVCKLAGTSSKPIIIRVRHHDDRWLHMEMVLTNMLHLSAIRGVLLTGHDVTDRVRAEHALVESDLRYQALFERSNDVIFLIDFDGCFIAANQQAREFLGYSMEELNTMRTHEGVSKEEVEKSQQMFKRIRNGEDIPLYERKFERKDGKIVYGEINLTLVEDADGNPAYIQSVVRDITHRKALQAELEHSASHDPLTKLPNGNLFMDKVNEHITNKLLFALFFIDLDGFKQINDQLGHDVGDKVLQIIARRLKSATKRIDVISRFGGDEFTLLAPGITEKTCQAIAGRILKKISEPVLINKVRASVSASIGVSLSPDHSEDARELLVQADHAMYQAKREGKNQAVLWDQSIEGSG